MRLEEIENIKINLGIYFLKLRTRNNITRKQVTEATGLVSHTIINIEFGRGCSLDSLIIYRDFLKSLPKT